MKNWLIACVILLGSFAQAQTETILHSFDSTQFSAGSYTQLRGGVLYGTTQGNGGTTTNAKGTVYKLTNSGGTWTETTLWSVPASTDTVLGSPQGTLAFDASGNIYGASNGSGDCGSYSFCGSVWKLSAPSYGETTLWSFTNDSNGHLPRGGVLLNGADGNLYGTTYAGGSNGTGTIWMLDPNASPVTITYLHQFGSGECANPSGPIILISDILIGTGEYGGPASAGCVWSLALHTPGGPYYQVGYYFQGGTSDGFRPQGQPVFRSDGVYVTTTQSGAYGGGTLEKIDTTVSPYTATVIHSFGSLNDGSVPQGNVLSDGTNLFLTTLNGSNANGTVVKFAPDGSGGWTEDILYKFTGSVSGTGDLDHPAPGITSDGTNLYGAALDGGANAGCDGHSCGGVWKVQP